MAPKFKVTKDEIVLAAVDIIRDKDVSAITAQEIAKRMNTSTRPMFNYFATLEELREAAVEKARELYNKYAEEGFSQVPAFKGFGIAYIRFAMEEPALFRVLFLNKSNRSTIKEFLNKEGHLNRIIQTVMDIFQLEKDDAEWLYENLWTYAHGLAAFCAIETARFTEAEIAEKLGTICRGLLISLNYPKDERTGFVPGKDKVIPGSMNEYRLKK